MFRLGLRSLSSVYKASNCASIGVIKGGNNWAFKFAQEWKTGACAVWESIIKRNMSTDLGQTIEGDCRNRGFRIALIQMHVGMVKEKNLQNAHDLIREARDAGAEMICLPECFNSPYGIQYFAEHSERIPDGPTCRKMSSLADFLNIYLVAGSIPERGDDNNLYNTCVVFGPNGEIIGKHRKMHLFDINVPGKITFKESTVLKPGDAFTIIPTKWCKIGIGICYDLRFPEVAQVYRQAGCDLVIYPGAFNMTTGPAHWELLQRSRALDNQMYVATISPARDLNAAYVCWGHSMIVNPWGENVVEAEDKQEILYWKIDLDYLELVRSQIPVSVQKRADIYGTIPLLANPNIFNR